MSRSSIATIPMCPRLLPGICRLSTAIRRPTSWGVRSRWCPRQVVPIGPRRSFPIGWSPICFIARWVHSVMRCAPALVRAVGGWREEYMRWEDWELGLRLLLATDRVVWIERPPLVHVYLHADSITGYRYAPNSDDILQAIAHAHADVEQSNHPDKRRLHRLLLYKQMVVAGLCRPREEPARARNLSLDPRPGSRRQHLAVVSAAGLSLCVVGRTRFGYSGRTAVTLIFFELQVVEQTSVELDGFAYLVKEDILVGRVGARRFARSYLDRREGHERLVREGRRPEGFASGEYAPSHEGVSWRYGRRVEPQRAGG